MTRYAPLQPGQSPAIEIRLDDVSQLFDTMDPFPFRERDLAKEADEYICDWADELPADKPVQIRIHLPASSEADPAVSGMETSVQHHFTHREKTLGRELSDLFRLGRRTLLIGLTVLGLCLILGQTFAAFATRSSVSHFVEEGFIIVGWVALWRPLDIFLYDWWALDEKKKLYHRLANAYVSVSFYDDAVGGGKVA